MMFKQALDTEKEALLELKGVSYSYGLETVLKDVTFTLREGDFAGLVGQNGSGKSTLVRLMLGLQPLQRGSISWQGDVLKGQDSFVTRASLAYVPQRQEDYNESFPITVEEVVRTGFPPRGKIRRELLAREELAGVTINQLVEEAMELTSIRDLAKRRFGDLSGGQRQRTLLARSLVSRQKLLVLDEPTAGLDARSEGQLYELLHRLNNHEGKTIFLVSHDMSAITAHSNRMLCLGADSFFEHPIHEPTDEDFYMRLYGFNVVPHHSHHHGLPHDLIPPPNDSKLRRRSTDMEQNNNVQDYVQPGGPRIPDQPDGPRIPTTPSTPEIPNNPDGPGVTPGTPTPEMPPAPQEPEIPEREPTPKRPSSPPEPETPGFPERTPGPIVPSVPDMPTRPDAPNEPEIPNTPDKPEIPQPSDSGSHQMPEERRAK